MRVAILTSGRFGTAARCLPALVEAESVEVVLVIHAQAQFRSRRQRLIRDLRKVARIGILGALNGVRMRGWGRLPPSRDLYDLAREHGVRLETSPRTNAARTRELLKSSGAELGISLGNGYIAPDVFTALPLGMINLHTELLPRFRGAASVIWSIHAGERETGFTIHQVSEQIDAGDILYQERYAIRWQPTLAETVRATVAETAARVPTALARVVRDYPTYRARAVPQGHGNTYTTPTITQFFRMVRNHRRMWKEATPHT